MPLLLCGAVRVSPGSCLRPHARGFLVARTHHARGRLSAQLQAGARPLVRRLMLLEELNALLPALCRSEPVAGAFRQLAAGLPASEAPAAWWDVEADVALLVGASRHGFGNYEAIRRDLELEPAFQVRHAC